MASASMRRIVQLPGFRHLRPYWYPLRSHLRNLMLLPASMPGLIRSKEQRALFRDARAFIRTLPDRLREPLPVAVKKMEGDMPPDQPNPRREKVTRNLVDLAVLLHRRSPLGLCLRRSLTRYYFLRREGLPLQVHFGARFVDGKPDREITGHAWLTLDGRPYYEPGKNWRGFTVMLSFPQSDKISLETDENKR